MSSRQLAVLPPARRPQHERDASQLANSIGLGTITEFAATFRGTFGLLPEEVARLARAERYEFHAIARDLLRGQGRVEYPHRVVMCQRYRRFGAEYIEVRRSGETGAAYYAGLMVCGQSLLCPSCGVRVAQERCREISTALEVWKERGGLPGLITLTLPHYRSQGLLENLEALLGAYRRLLKNGTYRRLCKRFGLAHSIKALEITWGRRNGFHPHLHILGFFAGDLDAEAFGAELARLWLVELRAALGEVDAAAVLAHGSMFQLGFSAGAKYLSKVGRTWGLAEEVSYANRKRGRVGNYSPADLLRAVRDGTVPEAGAVYRELAASVPGLHVIQWSRGMREALGLGEERSDEEIADGVDQADAVLGRITLSDWAAVRAAGWRAQLRLLELADFDPDAAAAFVDWCAGRDRVVGAGEVS